MPAYSIFKSRSETNSLTHTSYFSSNCCIIFFWCEFPLYLLLFHFSGSLEINSLQFRCIVFILKNVKNIECRISHQNNSIYVCIVQCIYLIYLKIEAKYGVTELYSWFEFQKMALYFSAIFVRISPVNRLKMEIKARTFFSGWHYFGRKNKHFTLTMAHIRM